MSRVVDTALGSRLEAENLKEQKNMTLHFLQPLGPVLSPMLVAVLVDVASHLVPRVRDRLWPLLGLPAAMAGWLQRKLDRAGRGRAVRMGRGVISLLAIVLAGTVFGAVAEIAARGHHAVAALVWFSCLRVTFPWSAGRALVRVWHDVPRGTFTKGMAVLHRRKVPIQTSVNAPDKHAVARMLVESVAASLHRGWLTAVFWALVAALLHGPALMVAVMVTFLGEAERVIVTRETSGSAFAFGCEAIEAALNFVPSRIAALFWALGAIFTPGARPVAALRLMFAQGSSHRTRNAGWPVAAVAGALHVALPAGHNKNKGGDVWIGAKDATARLGVHDIQKALWLHGVTCGLVFLALTALLLLAVAA